MDVQRFALPEGNTCFFENWRPLAAVSPNIAGRARCGCSYTAPRDCWSQEMVCIR